MELKVSEKALPAENRPPAAAAEEQFLQLQADVLRAMSHPARLQILLLLQGGERCVCEFEPLLGLRQPNISQHLAALRAANLVNTRRDGLRVMYSIADPAILAVIDLVAGIVRRRGAELSSIVGAASQPRQERA